MGPRVDEILGAKSGPRQVRVSTATEERCAACLCEIWISDFELVRISLQ